MSESQITTEINRRVTEELESDIDLGTDDFDDDFSAFISDQPIGMRVKDIYEKLGQAQPSELALYRMFEVWLIPHRFSLLRKKGLAEPTAVGIEVEYTHQNSTCSIISLIPGPRWQQHGTAAIGTNLTGKVKATGEIEEVPGLNPTPKFSIGGLGFDAGANGEIGFSFKWSVATPIISAVGQGSSQCQWRFDKDNDPLFGKTIETWSVLALPKRQKELEYKIRCYYLRRTLFFPTRREGDFVAVKCQLVT